MLHVVGEILVDQFISDVEAVRFPGGAPFNVACNVEHFGGEVSFYGSIGEDESGYFLSEYVKEKNFKTLILKTQKQRRTTVATVTLFHGERSFKFFRNYGSDYLLSLYNMKKLNIKKGDIVHLGSLMLSEKEGLRFIKSAIKYIKSIGAIFSFDVNYRDDIFPDKITAKRIYRLIIRYADLIKISEDELEVLSNKKTLECQLKDLFTKEQNVFVTLGKKGSFFYKNEKITKVETFVLPPKDTTGAGDAFYSYVLYSLSKDINILNNEEDVKLMLLKANVVGALATQKKGAIDAVPTIDELEQYYLNLSE